MQGEVTSVHKTGFSVFANGETLFCILRRKFEEVVVVGDFVTLTKQDDKYIITEILPRKNFIARYDFYKQRNQGFAANVGTIFVVTSANREFSPQRIRRFLALSGNQDVRKIIVLTKIDLLTGNSLEEYTKTLAKEFPTTLHVAINAKDKKQVQKLAKQTPAGESMLLLGTSGVGKSTIINTLTDLGLKTSETKGERHFNKGKHTTSSRNLYYTKCGRKIIDIPGIRIVGLEELVARSSDLFDSIEDLALQCKYTNCKHLTEDKCAVKLAITSGELAQEELERYRQTITNSERKGLVKI